ncbi:PD-(D/E)XK nuclease family protein [Ramlibacter sp.]|uniref:PDDEXK-like family protein n=1 Tax=Ramlibacter sp. TaxID=1917967 RepID=UPI0035B0B752
MRKEDLSEFMADAGLVKLIEAVKVSDDMLDVVELTENQHSDMLAWCLNPNEGHAQGDAVLKDLLIAAFAKGAACTYDNKKFFAEWTPARIRRTSFGSAFVSREFQISLPDMRRGRLDLFVVDPQNKILVVIENKVGASLTAGQLSGYWHRAKQDIGGRRAFQDFAFVFIVLDREIDGYTEESLSELGTKWCLLDYSWLEASAERARHHLARHNQAAQLLMSYCQKQTAWESVADHEILIRQQIT